jgi:hypothetical protein
VRDRLTNYGRPRRDLLRLYERIPRGEVVKDVPISPTHSALKLSGAVVATAEGTLRVRNEIYRHLFTAEWARRAMPVEWKPRLAIAASVVLLLGGFITWHWLVQPRNYIDVLMRVQDDAGLAESTAAKLRAIFGYSGRADELLANFWRRQALAAEGGSIVMRQSSTGAARFRPRIPTSAGGSLTRLYKTTTHGCCGRSGTPLLCEESSSQQEATDFSPGLKMRSSCGTQEKPPTLWDRKSVLGPTRSGS